MRALRDFNVPKIVVDDMPVFMGLIGDLFPALDVPRKRDLEFEKNIKKATLDQQLQAEDNFILKVLWAVVIVRLNIAKLVKHWTSYAQSIGFCASQAQ
jgi:hypothetical protein